MYSMPMINIVIPMAGRGSRMASRLRPLPKPLIEVMPGKRMIDIVIDYLTPSEPHTFIFICQDEHVKRYGLDKYFSSRTKRHRIVRTRKITAGPASSVLLAERFINNRDELMTAYCDDYLELDMTDFLARSRIRGNDGTIIIYPSRDVINSFAQIDKNGRILRTAEKEAISRWATAGLYYFRRGRDFVKAGRRMIRHGRRSRGEYYVCPVFNEMIADGKTVLSYPIRASQNLGMGTPAELRRFKRRVNSRRSR